MKTKEELCGKASRLVTGLFYQLTGRMYQRRIMKEEIGHLLLKDSNGKRERCDLLKKEFIIRK